MPTAPPFPDVLLALLVAAVLGGVVGFQREYTERPAGIRTHSLVSLGSCAFASYSALLADTRIAAGVITGIGFLGAGAIVRHGMTPRGLTTAASIWTASAIGLGVGLRTVNWLWIALGLTILTLVVLAISDEAVMRLVPRRTIVAIRVDADLDRLAIEKIDHELARLVRRVQRSDELTIRRDPERRAQLGYVITVDARADLANVFTALSAIDGILCVAVATNPMRSE
jgi:putative Mg2+ transporter-C (MgtC) family protein